MMTFSPKPISVSDLFNLTLLALWHTCFLLCLVTFNISYLLSGFADQKAIWSEPSSLPSCHSQKRPLNPTLERFLCFCAVCPSVVSDQWGEALALCCTLWNCLFNYCSEVHQTCFTFRDPGHCHMIASMVSLTLWPDTGSSDSYDLQKVFIPICFVAEVEPPKWGSLEDAFSAVASSSPASSKSILSIPCTGLGDPCYTLFLAVRCWPNQ